MVEPADTVAHEVSGTPDLERPVPWLVSAPAEEGLAGRAEQLSEYLVAHPELDPVDVAYSLALESTHEPHRAAIIGSSRADLHRGLAALANGDTVPGVVRGVAGRHGKVVFVYPGMGAQWAGMAVDLLGHSPVFREQMNALDRVVESTLGWSMFTVLHAEDAGWLNQMDIAQPILHATALALGQVWHSLGVRPDAIVGHSIGELPAACAAGVYSCEDAMFAGIEWARAQQSLHGHGKMALAQGEREHIEELIRPWSGQVWFAGMNGTRSVMLSGEWAAMDACVDHLAERDVHVREANGVHIPAHSPLLGTIDPILRERLDGLDISAPSTPLYSAWKGGRLTAGEVDNDLWCRVGQEPILFDSAVRALAEDGHRFFVEVGAHPLLVGPIGETDPEVAAAGSIRRGDAGPQKVLTGLCELFVQGMRVDWAEAFANLGGGVVDLPCADGRTVARSHEPRRAKTTIEVIREQVTSILGATEPVDLQTSFFELGLDSSTAVQLRNRLSGALGRALPTTLVFDYPTPAVLSEFLERPSPETSDEEEPEAHGDGRSDEPVAIVGMACRFPGGVGSPEDLWDLVASEVDAVERFPVDRGWDTERLYDPEPGRAGRTYVREGGFLESAGGFDADFFGIAPREALAMDPQQRVLLEVSWETLERAGVAPTELRGERVGVFVGAMGQEYGPRLHEASDEVGGLVLTGNLGSVASGRIAYTYGFEGPAVTVDTACSSSLVALHTASQSLRNGECSLALVGGVTVMPTPGVFVEFSRQRALSAEARCKSFADSADGTIWAEGAAMVLVQPLSEAIREGRRVWGVVRGSAVNQDGASNGLTAPNGPSQQRLIKRTLANAGVRPSDVDAVEAHGTGTTLGDPIEAQAIVETYGRSRDTPLWLGSLKSNIGHAQAAAGLGGVIKMLMAMRHGVLPRTLHVDKPTAHVDWAAGTVQLLSEAQPWPETPGRPRRAAVSAFGISGTNAHVLLEQAPDLEAALAAPCDELRPVANVVPVVWPLAAQTSEALRSQARKLLEHVREHPELSVSDIGYSLATTRASLRQRAALVAADRDDFLRGLHAVSSGEQIPPVVRGEASAHGTVFVFPGQGAQWAGMALELSVQDPTFAECWEKCARAVEEHVDYSVLGVLREEPDAPPLERVDVVQPVLFTVMVALADLWRAHGVVPTAVVGHSQGEIAAACVAGALSLDDAARVVCFRSRILSELTGHGGMASISAEEAKVQAWVSEADGGVSVAAVNSPGSIVVSGESSALDELLARAEAAEVRARRIPVDYASHSCQVESVHDELVSALAGLTPGAGTIPLYSTLTGGPLDTATMDAEYWYANLRNTVRFQDAIEAMPDADHTLFIEISPHPVLTPGLHDIVDAQGANGLVVETLRRDNAGRHRFRSALATAYAHGIDPHWPALYSGARTVDLPTYPFQQENYWLLPGNNPRSDSLFWDMIGRQDVHEFANALNVAEDESLATVLPALAAWHQQDISRSLLNSRRYRVDWVPVAGLGSPVLAGDWLIIDEGAGEQNLIRDIAAVLSQGGANAVVSGVDDIGGMGERRFAGIISPLMLDENPHPEYPSVPSGYARTINLMQQLDESRVDGRLWCVTRDAVAVSDGDMVHGFAQGLAWGLGHVMFMEQPDRWGGLLDLPAKPDEGHVRTLISALSGATGEDQLAIREGGVYARRLVRAPVTVPDTWNPQGTILITGGTGAIGAQVARWTAREGADHVVLASRSGPDAPGAADLVVELEELGAAVTVVACDATDREALAELLEAHPPDAVMHASVVLDDASMSSLTIDQVNQVLSGKAVAALNLHELTRDLELSAFILFSSLGSVLGLAGQANYAPGNAFLDALAHRRRAEGLPATAIAWGSWGGSGLAYLPSVADSLSRHGLIRMDPDFAVTALETALSDPFLLVADIDWERVPREFVSPLVAGLAQVSSTESGPEFVEYLGQLPEQERGPEIEREVRSHLAVVLGHAEPARINTDQVFTEMGMDSMTAIELRNRLSTTLGGLSLPATIVFSHPTLSSLAAYLLDRLGEQTSSTVGGPLSELDRLEAALSAQPGQPHERDQIAARLRSLLRQLEPDVIDSDLDGLGSDELLALIDDEFSEKESSDG